MCVSDVCFDFSVCLFVLSFEVKGEVDWSSKDRNVETRNKANQKRERQDVIQWRNSCMAHKTD